MSHEVLSSQDLSARDAAENPAVAPAAYERPALERLGTWSAMTLTTTIIITP